jgi:hypothetical protein
MATAKTPKRQPTVWAILDRERNLQLYVGREPPCLDGAFAAAPCGTRFIVSVVSYRDESWQEPEAPFDTFFWRARV